ncbi:hypothetical protein MXB_3631 [Myxobolus squamalis]|nr:hypothetical protein MXB_3631 [Myxobolus squamalis]
MYAVHPDQLGNSRAQRSTPPNDIYFDRCKNTATLFDSAAFTIPTKQQVADKVDWQREDQSKVDFLV